MTEPELRRLLEIWKRRLGLDTWRIILRVEIESAEDAYMEVSRCVYERAVIHVAPWMLGIGNAPENVLLKGADLTDDFVEVSLVHELLHLHTRNMRGIVRDDLFGQLQRDAYHHVEAAMELAEEQCVDRLAEALVRAFAA